MGSGLVGYFRPENVPWRIRSACASAAPVVFLEATGLAPAAPPARLRGWTDVFSGLESYSTSVLAVLSRAPSGRKSCCSEREALQCEASAVPWSCTACGRQSGPEEAGRRGTPPRPAGSRGAPVQGSRRCSDASRAPLSSPLQQTAEPATLERTLKTWRRRRSRRTGGRRKRRGRRGWPRRDGSRKRPGGSYT